MRALIPGFIVGGMFGYLLFQSAVSTILLAVAMAFAFAGIARAYGQSRRGA